MSLHCLVSAKIMYITFDTLKLHLEKSRVNTKRTDFKKILPNQASGKKWEKKGYQTEREQKRTIVLLRK